MTAQFPANLVTTGNIPNANPLTTLSANNHSGKHDDMRDEIIALEAKVGKNSSAVTTSHDYKLQGVTGTDQAVGATQTVSMSNKTLVAPKITMGSDAIGDLDYNSSGATGVQARLAIGTSGQILTSNGTTPTWANNPSVDTTLYPPTGMISPYAGSSAPTNWLLCDGSAISRTTYATLFAITSTTYGVGDGSTTFNLPDLRSRIPVGVGTGTKVATFSSRASNVLTVTGLTNANNNEFQTGQSVTYHTSGSVITGLTNDTVYFVVRVTNTTFSLATTLANAQNGTVIVLSSDGTGTQTFTQTLTARTRGDTGGEENHAISSTEMLAHIHGISDATSGSTWFNLVGGAGVPGASGRNTGSFGGNSAMNAMQPFLALNYIIKT